MDIQQLRSETPGCQQRIHLNNAGASLMPQPVIDAVVDHITLESRIGGYEAAEVRQSQIESAYRDVAALIGTNQRNIAFTENATVSTSQALSSIPLQPDDVILTTRNDYASSQIQFLSLQSRLGVKVVHAAESPQGGVDVDSVADFVQQHRPKIVSVAHVPTNSGLVQDVCSIGKICRQQGVWYLVDACQSVGQMPIDVGEIGCDFLSVSSRKFLRGPRGAGFLYVSDRVLEHRLLPLQVDMRGADWIAMDRYQPADDAKRFENWEFAWALVLGTGQAARYATNVGLENIRDRTLTLVARLRTGLAAINKITLLDRGSERSAIVSMTIDGHDPLELVQRLRDRQINTSAQLRVYAVIDYDDKGVSASLRLSPHYYNTEGEIDTAVGVIGELVSW